MFEIASLFLVVLVASVYAAPPEQHNRIINGKPIQIEDIPYLVQLRNKETDYFMCGGSLVSSTHVVTAAHCLKELDPTDLVVVAGTSSRYDKGVRSNVTKGTTHPYFNEGVTNTHDVAVLKLATPLKGRNVATVALCTERVLPDGADLQVSGWGSMGQGYGAAAANTVSVPVVPFKQCEKQYSYRRLSGTMMCASVPGEKDACQGDSGGPAIYNNKLCGIVSWGRGCAQAEYPGVYTVVGTVLGFIHRAMEE